MDFNLDNLFILIGIGAFIISIFVRKKKSQEAISKLVNDEIEEESNIYSEINEELVYENAGLSKEVSEKSMMNNMSAVTKQKSPSIEKHDKTSEKTHYAEKKDIEQFDLRNAVIMSTILERKYF